LRNPANPFTFSHVHLHTCLLTLRSIKDCDAGLAAWPDTEHRSFAAETGRLGPVRKSLARIVQVPGQQLVDIVSAFTKFDTANPNRMAAAKVFAKQHPCSGTALSSADDTGAPANARAIRAFNLVIFHQHAAAIARHLGLSYQE